MLMNKSVVASILTPIANSKGYYRKADRYWKSNGELTAIIQLQSSRWDHGVYINIGVIPTIMVTRNVPPGVAYWPFMKRAESLPSPFQEDFAHAITCDPNTLNTENMTKAIKWLLEWIDKNLIREDFVRSMLQRKVSPTPEWAACLQEQERASMDWIMTDWAHQQLKDPQHYYGKTAYYN